MTIRAGSNIRREPSPDRSRREAMRRIGLVGGAVLFTMLLASCRKPIAPAADRDAIAATVEKFHQALARGDAAAASGLLAVDAQILESGERQTRAEYIADHLPADINFARSVASTRSGIIVRQEGNVAWATANSRSTGQFLGRDLDSDGTELIVLSKQPEGWRIRAIHWSGHSHR